MGCMEIAVERVSVTEARKHLPELLRRVAAGERVVITRYGAPVAILRDYEPAIRTDIASATAEIREYRRRNRLDGLSLRELIEEGRCGD